MDSESHDSVHIFLFPFMAHGHMIPVSDMAKLFASHGVKITIVTTPLNAIRFAQTTQSSKFNIQIKAIEFPSEEAGLPKGCENVDTLPSPNLVNPFFKATRLLQPQFEELLKEVKPTCIVADMFFPWATEAAAKFGIPRLVFHGTSFFAMCASDCVKVYEPYNKVASDTEPFVIPYLPGKIELTRAQVPDFIKNNVLNDVTQLLKEAREAELKSFGIIMNSFYELEPVYADFYRNELGRKAWHIGPVSLCNRETEEKVQRGKEATIDEHECLKWLDSKKPDSVVYVCFGSVADFNSTQLKEIAMALEAAGQDFIWVVRKGKDEVDEWLPEGFEERMEGKGLIIRGWAPQVLILDHPSVGGFVTHCGWNSTLEGISAGLPMVTWPVSAEQFYNEKLVTQVLKIGVGVGTQKWVRLFGDSVKKEAIVKAVSQIMVGEEAEERRKRARELGKQARRAVEEGGSSYQDFNKLIQELKSQQVLMDTESQQQLHIFFFPFMAPGHSIPVIEIAKQFASYSVKSTIITTPLNAPQFSKAIQRRKHLEFDHEIELLLLKFPSVEAGLPQECESYNLATSTLEMELTFFKAITLLEPQFEQVLDQHRPHCLVVDTMFPWATSAASKFGIPSLLFHGTGFFSLCASKSIIIHQPHLKLSSDSESVVIPDLPVEIKIKGSQIPSFLKLNLVNEFTKLFRSSKDAEDRSYGVIVNSFYELEPDYADHYRKMFGKKIWIIGPGSLYNKVAEHKAERGCMESIEEVHKCLYWLNSKKPKTVVYVCFGSLTNFNDFQLLEIAVGLEASGQEFIWVVNKEKKDKEEWLPEGFEQRMEGKGLIIRGWAPQVLILEHEAIGGFVTHCGWNSILEGVSAGVPMITWPVSAEQPFNEKLVTEILRTGVAVGADIWGTFADGIVKMEAGVKRVAIEKSVSLIMVGDEAEVMRSRAKELGKMARMAVEEGGSSFKDLRALIAELRSLSSPLF